MRALAALLFLLAAAAGLQSAAGALPAWYACPASCSGACRCGGATPPLALDQVGAGPRGPARPAQQAVELRAGCPRRPLPQSTPPRLCRRCPSW